MSVSSPLNDVMTFLLARRSVKAKNISDPAPCNEELEHILTAAMRVPDHKKLAPFRFIVLDKAQQAAFGEVCAKRYVEVEPRATQKHYEAERQRVQAAPLLIILLFTPRPGAVPLIEQQLCCGAAGMNLLHAVHACGYAGQWLTEWIAYDETIIQWLSSSEEGACIAGLFYIGTPNEQPEERARPDFKEKVQFELPERLF